MTTKPRHPSVYDADAENAAKLAKLLTHIAEALRTGAHPELAVERRAFVRRLVATWNRYDDPRPSVQDNQLRDYCLDVIATLGKTVAKLRKVAPIPADASPERRRWHEADVARFAAMAVEILGNDIPDYATAIAKNRAAIEALMGTYLRPRGGRGKRLPIGQSRAELRARLCEAMGWTASSDAIRQHRQRQRAAARKRAAKLVTD